MTNYDAKESKVVDNISATIKNLDATLEKLVSLEDDTKKHSIKEWFEEKKAIHEIKKILHDAGKYDQIDDDAAYQTEMNDIKSYISELEKASKSN